MFINELNLYVDYYKKDLEINAQKLSDKKKKYLLKFKEQLLIGIEYYKELVPKFTNQTMAYKAEMLGQLRGIEMELRELGVEVA